MNIASLPSVAPSTVAPKPGQPWPLPKDTAPLDVAPKPGQPWPLPKFHSGVEGVSLLGSVAATTPLINFPGIKAGDNFDIAKGSKVGFISPKGSASIATLDANLAAFRVQASAFGQKVDLTVSVERLSDELVRITQQPASGAPSSAEGRIVDTRENYAEFLSLDGKDRTVIQHDGNGKVVIDAVIPTFGNAHLILQKR